MSTTEPSASALIDAKIAALDDWRGAMLAQVRALIRQADPDIVEEVKWRKPSNPDGVAVWSKSGIICTGEVYKDKVKLTFARGASVDEPDGLFNASLDAGTRRAVDLREGRCGGRGGVCGVGEAGGGGGFHEALTSTFSNFTNSRSRSCSQRF